MNRERAWRRRFTLIVGGGHVRAAAEVAGLAERGDRIELPGELLGSRSSGARTRWTTARRTPSPTSSYPRKPSTAQRPAARLWYGAPPEPDDQAHRDPRDSGLRARRGGRGRHPGSVGEPAQAEQGHGAGPWSTPGSSTTSPSRSGPWQPGVWKATIETDFRVRPSVDA
jgi:hypothetical protein